MAQFQYTLINGPGRQAHGRTEAPSAEQAMRMLESSGAIVAAIQTVDASSTSATRSIRAPLLEVTHSVAAVLRVGVPLSEALSFSAGDANASIADVLSQVASALSHGDSLAAALAKHPAVFPAAYVGVIRAGERAGNLTAAFERLTDQLEREARVRDRLVSAAIYPGILACAGGFAVCVLVLFVLPRFAELLTGAGATLPTSTRLLLTTAAWCRAHWPVVALIMLSTLVSISTLSRAEAGRRLYFAALLRLPVLGDLRRAILGWRFSRLLGTLLDGGAPVVAALGETASSLDDPIAREEVERLRTRVREGASLSHGLSEGVVFPALVTRMAAVGERSSQLPEFLLKAADLFEARTDRAIQRALALLEPAMMVVFGGIIGFVALALLQAIYGFNANTLR